MKYLKLFEEYKDYHSKSSVNDLALEFTDKYYSDETGQSPYGDYEEILDRVNDFVTTDFPNGINNLPSTVTLYRLLNVDSIEDINKEELGVSYVGDKDWFEDYDFLDSFLYRYGEEMKKWFIVTIRTSSDNIDIEGTLSNRAEYPDEYEIKILNDNNLDIISIEETEPIHPSY